MSSFTAANFVQLIACIVLHYVPFYPTEVYAYARHKRQRWWSVIPFELVWIALNAMCSVTLFLYLLNGVVAAHWTYQWVPSLIISNALLAKAWPRLFASKERRVLSVLVSWALFATALAAVVIMGVDHDNAGPLWFIPLMFYSIYTAWLLFASMLATTITIPRMTISFAMRVPSTTRPKSYPEDEYEVVRVHRTPQLQN